MGPGGSCENLSHSSLRSSIGGNCASASGKIGGMLADDCTLVKGRGDLGSMVPDGTSYFLAHSYGAFHRVLHLCWITSRKPDIHVPFVCSVNAR